MSSMAARIVAVLALALTGCITFSAIEDSGATGGDGSPADGGGSSGVCQPSCTTVDQCVGANENPSNWSCAAGVCTYSLCLSDADCAGSMGVCMTDAALGTKACAYPCPIEGCLPGTTCVSGYCQTSGCTLDSDCGGGFVCSDGACHVPCVDDSACGDTKLECVDGLCQTFACTAAIDCADRFGTRTGPDMGWVCVT